MNFVVFECPGYDDVRDHFWTLFHDFGGHISPVAQPDGAQLAEFMQQSSQQVAAFIDSCFLVRGDPESPWLEFPGVVMSDGSSDDFVSVSSGPDTEYFDFDSVSGSDDYEEPPTFPMSLSVAPSGCPPLGGGWFVM